MVIKYYQQCTDSALWDYHNTFVVVVVVVVVIDLLIVSLFTLLTVLSSYRMDFCFFSAARTTPLEAGQ